MWTRSNSRLDASLDPFLSLFSFRFRWSSLLSLCDRGQLGAGLLHVMDFSSLWVCSGRGMPGKLGAAMPPGDVPLGFASY